jgi:halogenation protein CepH
VSYHPRALQTWVQHMNSPLPTDVDVLIIGAGPAGATLATLLGKYRPETRVLIAERRTFPRYKIGESLIVDINRVLGDMDALERVDAAGFLRKYGATFIWGPDRTPRVFEWSDYIGAGYPMAYTWHVERPRYDQLLVDMARERGAQVAFQQDVTELMTDGERVTGAVLRGDDGTDTPVRARWVVDCAGLGGPLSRRFGQRKIDDKLRNIAVYAYFRDVAWRDDWNGSPEHGRTLIVSHEQGWFWFIPITDEITSVGFVTSLAAFSEAALEPRAFFESRAATLGEGAELFAHAELVDYRQDGRMFHSVQEFGYGCEKLWGPGWVLCGDSSGFVDAILSIGVFVASNHAQFLAYALRSVMDGQCDEELALRSYATTARENLDAFRSVAHMLYAFNPAGSVWWEGCASALRASNLVPTEADAGAFAAFFTGFAARSGLYDDALGSFGGDFVLEMGRQLSGAEQLFAPEAYAGHAMDARRLVSGNPRLRLRATVSAQPFALPRNGTGALWPVTRLAVSVPGDLTKNVPAISRRMYVPEALSAVPALLDGSRTLRDVAQALDAGALGVSAEDLRREVVKVAYRLAVMGALEPVGGAEPARAAAAPGS